MSKKIKVAIMGDGTTKMNDVGIKEGTTRNKLLEELGLSKESKVWRKKNHEPIKSDVDLFKLLDEGEIVQVSPHAEVGTGQ